jgi:hypothetical protein
MSAKDLLTAFQDRARWNGSTSARVTDVCSPVPPHSSKSGPTCRGGAGRRGWRRCPELRLVWSSAMGSSYVSGLGFPAWLVRSRDSRGQRGTMSTQGSERRYLDSICRETHRRLRLRARRTAHRGYYRLSDVTKDNSRGSQRCISCRGAPDIGCPSVAGGGSEVRPRGIAHPSVRRDRQGRPTARRARCR